MKSKVTHGPFQKLSEDEGARGAQFMVAIILTHLLTPAEYGATGITMISITIANVVVQNEFNTALTQKKQADSMDFSSVCYSSLFVALMMHVLLYFAVPFIAKFYRIEELWTIMRVLMVVLLPGTVVSVQTAYVSRNMELKGLSFSTLVASLVSGLLNITMAYRGPGIWAMTGQQVAYCFALMLVLFFAVSRKPKLCFALERVQRIFTFGWKLLRVFLLDTIFSNPHGLLIGKIYNKELSGSYNQGEWFPKLIASNLGAAIQVVFLPIFSVRQDNIGLVWQMVWRTIQLSSFAALSILTGLFAVGDNLMLAFLREQWLVCVPFLRIICISYYFQPTHITNLQAINVAGRSDIPLKLEIVKKALSMLALVIGIQYSVAVMVGLKAPQGFLCTLVNAAPNKKLLGCGITHQRVGAMPPTALSVVMDMAVWFVGKLVPGVNVRLTPAMQTGCGVAVYIGLVRLFKMGSFRYLCKMVRRRREQMVLQLERLADRRRRRQEVDD